MTLRCSGSLPFFVHSGCGGFRFKTVLDEIEDGPDVARKNPDMCGIRGSSVLQVFCVESLTLDKGLGEG